MSSTPPFNQRPSQQPSGYVQWDDTPSLADSLSWRLQRHGEHGKVTFADTVPADLLPLQPSSPFREPVEGLSVREITDDDLFVHLFGRPDPE